MYASTVPGLGLPGSNCCAGSWASTRSRPSLRCTIRASRRAPCQRWQSLSPARAQGLRCVPARPLCKQFRVGVDGFLMPKVAPKIERPRSLDRRAFATGWVGSPTNRVDSNKRFTESATRHPCMDAHRSAGFPDGDDEISIL